jgi:hypothetical protein
VYKICSKCKEEKLLCNFSKNIDSKDRHRPDCKNCVRKRNDLNKEKIAAKRASYYQANKNKIAESDALYYQANKEQIAEYYKSNKERISLKKAEYQKANKDKIALRMSKYQKDNKDKINAHSAKRRAAKLKATPCWLTESDFEQIKQFYTLALTLEIATGEKYHVDHIIPLQGKNVCGLHVPWNLQVLPAIENKSKSNKLLQD